MIHNTARILRNINVRIFYALGKSVNEWPVFSEGTRYNFNPELNLDYVCNTDQCKNQTLLRYSLGFVTAKMNLCYSIYPQNMFVVLCQI